MNLAAVHEVFYTVWGFLSTPLFELSGNKISIISILTAVAIFSVCVYLAKLSEKFTRRILAEKELDPGLKGSIERFVHYAVLITGAFITLDTIGISLNSLAALSAVLMVGIGFGLQNITQNFIAGLIILLERPIKRGDIVQVGGIEGRVADIHARSTIIHTRDDVAIIVPNSQFISEQVVNESFSGEKIRLHIKMGVSYASDVDKVKQVLIDVANSNPTILNSPKPTVTFEDFGNSSLDFDLRIWVHELWEKDIIMSDIRFKIAKEFRANKIEIPFPQRDLHIRSSDVPLQH